VKGRTVFLITHSITDSLLAMVTRIVVMERGLVVASGTHNELVKNCGAYARLYQARTLTSATEPGAGAGSGRVDSNWVSRADAA